jgi:hypothetical protein
MPPDLSVIFRSLWEDVVRVHSEWDVFRRLYADGADTVDLLNKTAPGFFSIVQDALISSILLSIARLTDPKESAGKANLVLESLLEHLDERDHPGLKDIVTRKLTELRGACRPIRDDRNKRLAHTDRAVRMSPAGQLLPSLTVGDVQSALKGICDVLNTVQVTYDSIITGFEGCGPPGGAGAILGALKQAREHRESRRNS